MQQPIQQQMQQPEQMGVQQMQQQMVLCPVRVVYETQILMPPGDQIQPNQTLFINPQNPPPWVQNRQMQNPVIYVQQMPNNIVPTVQQHMDQNQLYLQHYQNYQQLMPQQIITQNQEQRPMQISNLIPQNMLQNFQTNISHNIQNMSDRSMQQTFGQMQNVGQNIQMPQNQVNLVSNNINRNEAVQNIVQAQPQSQFNHQKVEIKPGVFMNVGHQIHQSPVRPQPQVLTVNPMQNPMQTVPQTITTSANAQTLPQNVGLPRQVQTQSVGSQMSPPTFANSPNAQAMSRIRKVAPNTINRVSNPNAALRNAGPGYRPIQPRPYQYRTNPPNYQTVSTQSQISKPPIPNTGPTIVNINSTLPSMPNIQPIMPNATINYVKPEDNTNTNRKRKSESPDEIHRKMAAIQVNIATPPPKIINIPQRPAEYTINTPAQRIELKPNQNLNITVPVNNDAKTVELSQMSKLVENVQQAIQTDKSNATKPDVKDSQSTDKDKLVRNTVFTQARGRTLNDKETIIQIINGTTIVPIPTLESRVEVKLEDIKPLDNREAEKPVENRTDINNKPADNSLEANNKSLGNNIEVKHKPVDNSQEVKSQPVDNSVEVKSKSLEQNVEVKKEEQTMNHDMQATLNTANNKGMLPVDRGTKQERDFVLTHVLDGIVIQESNVAFPIREPTSRRTIKPTAVVKQEKVEKRETASPKREIVSHDLPQSTAGTKVEVKTKEGDDKPEQGENPLSELKHATVKSWTVEELSAYLSKNNWEETASLFLEHEIDGESLYLVSKTQLLTIGVKENHADLICAFVKS